MRPLLAKSLRLRRCLMPSVSDGGVDATRDGLAAVMLDLSSAVKVSDPKDHCVD